MPYSAAPLGGEILSGFLLRTATQGERSVAGLRGAIGAMGLINLLLIADGAQQIQDGSIKHGLMLLILIATTLSTPAFLYALRRGAAPRAALYASVSLDALIILTILLCSAIWPDPSYTGLIHLPHFAMFALALAASGLRLSRSAILLSAGLNCGGFLGLALLDIRINPVAREIRPDDYGAFCLLITGALLMAVAVQRRSRSLVLEGAAAALQADRARQRLGVYVSHPVAEAALATDDLSPGGERRTVAVLFSDLRSFTRYGEQIPPERLIRELNAYLEAMIAEVSAEGGVVDKYMGDAIMVVFGIPKPLPDDPARAVRTALRMQVALDRHNADRARLGLPPLRQGIGVHYGEAVAGNVGTHDRLQYTVIGDVVNTASRLEHATKELGIPVLLSDEVVAAARPVLGPLALAPVPPIPVRGRERPVHAWTTAPGPPAARQPAPEHPAPLGVLPVPPEAA